LLEDIQNNLLRKAEKLLAENIIRVHNLDEAKKAIKGKKVAFAPLCRSRECEDDLKFKTEGAKVLNIPDRQPKELSGAKCIICGEEADYFAYIGKSY